MSRHIWQNQTNGTPSKAGEVLSPASLMETHSPIEPDQDHSWSTQASVQEWDHTPRTALGGCTAGSLMPELHPARRLPNIPEMRGPRSFDLIPLAPSRSIRKASFEVTIHHFCGALYPRQAHRHHHPDCHPSPSRRINKHQT